MNKNTNNNSRGEVLVLGKPLTSNSKNFKEDELHDKRFMSFMLIPLAYEKPTFSFNYILEILRVENKIPHLKIFPKEPPVITYSFTNSLDDTFLASLISGMVNIGSGLRYLAPNISFSQNDLIKRLHAFIGDLPIAGADIASGFETLLKVVDGYTALLPKVWTHSEAGTALRLEFEEHLWVYGKDAPDRFRKVMDALKNFISPRVSKPIKEGSASVITDTQELNLASFLYSHPYFCRVADGKKPSKVIIPAGMVTNANINIDTKDMRFFFDENSGEYKGSTPNVLRVELEITPLHFPMVADPERKFEGKQNIVTFEKLINSWTP